MHKNQIPIILIYSRLVLGFLLVLIPFLNLSKQGFICCVLITFGLLSDIFDGILARHLKVSTIALRSLDSNVDTVFWTCVLLGAIFSFPNFFYLHWISITGLLVLETLAYGISYLKFKQTIATHSLLAKTWALSLLLFFLNLHYTQDSHTIFYICLGLGYVAKIEIVAIMLLLKKWHSDIPSLLAAIALNQGKEIKRNKLFNG